MKIMSYQSGLVDLETPVFYVFQSPGFFVHLVPVSVEIYPVHPVEKL